MTDILFNDKEKRQIHRQLPRLGKLVLPQTCSLIRLISHVGNCFEIWTGREIKGEIMTSLENAKQKTGTVYTFQAKLKSTETIFFRVWKRAKTIVLPVRSKYFNFYVPVLQLRQLTRVPQKSLIYSGKLLMEIVLVDVCLVQ